jgi:hypothetical protein
MRRRVLAGSIAILVAVATVVAAPQRAPATSTAEAATARRLAAIRDDPLLLRAFLREMPKGGDLHSHLSGAVYAESYLRWAAEDKLCLATATMSIVAGTCDAEAGQPPVAAVLQNPTLYNQAIDAMSMRHWNPALNGHDHFFAAFARFGPVTARTGDMLAEATARAAAEHVIYLELMLTPASAAVTRLARETGWNADLVELRSRLLAAGFREAVRAEASRRLDVAEVRRREILGCDGSQADPGCSVTVRYIAQVGRTAAPEVVFAQILAGFELVAADPRFVALNLVQAEDHPTSVRDFTLHMSMLDFLHRQYPNVRITLHAGELTSGLVPPEVLRSHVRQSVESGHAARIGHGIDLMDEDNPTALLRLLAAKKVLIETSLTSNDWILGVRGKHHPLRTYLRHGVPAAIVTDDLGVLRSSHTQEFQRAVEDQQLDYLTLKRLARNSLEHAFADWATKGRLQSDLERAFVDFERRQSAWQAPSRTTSDLHKRSAARPSEALRPTR